MKKEISIVVLCVGVLLLIIGLFLRVPGKNLDVEEYWMGDDYFTNEDYIIKEYVGGDAYNYMIGASLAGGEIAGTLAKKAIYITMGCLISSIGALALAFTQKERTESEQEKTMDTNCTSSKR